MKIIVRYSQLKLFMARDRNISSAEHLENINIDLVT